MTHVGILKTVQIEVRLASILDEPSIILRYPSGELDHVGDHIRPEVADKRLVRHDPEQLQWDPGWPFPTTSVHYRELWILESSTAWQHI